MKFLKEKKIPPFKNTQTVFAAIPELRDTHDAYVRAVMNDLNTLNILARVLEVHEAVYAIRMTLIQIILQMIGEPHCRG